MDGEAHATLPGDPLPSDHPAPHRGPVDGPSVWYGPEMAKSDEWIYPLSQDERDEILAALDGVRGRDIQTITRADFPLPGFGPTLDRLRQDVLRGRGFVLLRGLPIEDLSFEDVATLYWGVGSHIGNPRAQNQRGHLLGHVTDVQGKVVERARGYLNSRHLP